MNYVSAGLLAIVVAVSGCAGEGPVKPVGIEQKIEAARTRADHQEIAVVYGQEAERDKVAAERHRGLARAYGTKSWVWNERRAGGAISGARMAEHCERLVRIYQQAAEENLALAQLHRRLADEAHE